MKKSAAQVLKDAQELPERDRVRLIERLLESWEPPEDPGDDKCFMEELERRSLEVESGKARLLTWDEVRKRARAAVRAKR